MGETRPAQRLTWHLPVYALLLVLYFWFQFEPALYAHHHRVMFLMTGSYLREFLAYPGGAVEWVTQFVFQLFPFGPVGALFMATLSIALLGLAYGLLRDLLPIRQPLLLSSLPPLLYLAQQSHYSFPLVIGIKYCCTLACAAVYTRMGGRFRGAGLLLTLPLYVALGGWFLLFYCLLCGLYEALYAREPGGQWRAALHGLAYSLLPLASARFLFLSDLRQAYFYMVPHELYQVPYRFDPDLPYYLFFLSLPLVLVAYPLGVRLMAGRAGWLRRVAARGGVAAQSAVVVLAGAVLLAAGADGDEKRTIEVERLAAQGRWRELLDTSRQMARRSRQTLFHTNRALCHTGRLLDDLFEYAQVYGADGLFLTRKGIGGQIAMPASDLYLDLGHVSAARVMAYEGQTRQKHNPRLLQRLVVTNIISGDLGAARLFLGVLDQSPLHREWVRHWRDVLSHGEGGASNELVAAARAARPQADFFINTGQPHRDLARILAEHPENEMAQDYLLAYYLLEGRLGDVVECLRAQPRDPAALPRHVEEALVLTKAAAPEALEGTAFGISSATVQRFLGFNQRMAQLSALRGSAAARQALRAGFGDTFWYYANYIRPAPSQLKSRRVGVHAF